jgi:hypothetical protein
MAWLTNYWFVIVLGLVAAMFLFGFRTKDNKEGNIADHSTAPDDDKKEHKGGHSCCH